MAMTVMDPTAPQLPEVWSDSAALPSDDYPDWYDGRRLNEPAFCRAFLEERPMLCIGGKLFDINGPVESEGMLKKQIADRLEPYVTGGLAKKCSSILDYLKIRAHAEPLPLETDRIHFRNGIYHLHGEFEEKITFCANRLPIEYHTGVGYPTRWMRFLYDLLEKDDIQTLQEYMGYCLIPSTKAQKMLLIIGSGGEGKSRIGLVLSKLLGTAMNVGSIQKVETNAFARADLQHRLLLVDDDMDMNALPKTNYIKSIVTAESRMDLERKGEQSYQGQLYCRLMGFGNGTLHSLYDHSDGFFRRQILLLTKERPPHRVDDPFLSEKLEEELPGILLWCIDGLERLQDNGYRFTVSSRSKKAMDELRRKNDNVLAFLDSVGYIEYGPEKESSSKLLYKSYLLFCEDNAYKPFSMSTLSQEMGQMAGAYNIEPTNNIYLPNGSRVRGFHGVGVLRGEFLSQYSYSCK